MIRDADRVDGRQLRRLDEPGSDDRLLHGLLVALAAWLREEPLARDDADRQHP